MHTQRCQRPQGIEMQTLIAMLPRRNPFELIVQGTSTAGSSGKIDLYKSLE